VQTKAKQTRRERPKLVHWSEVQVSDPDAVPMSATRVNAHVLTEDGDRQQEFTIRHRGPVTRAAVMRTVSEFGFIPASEQFEVLS
jgi:hypothetical protein